MPLYKIIIIKLCINYILDDYEISSICINLALEIVKDKHDKKLINDRKELHLAHLSGEEYRNQVVLVAKLPE